MPRPNPPERSNAITDEFIGHILPTWLRQASPAQIRTLRSLFKAHAASQDQVRNAMRELVPLQHFARQELATLLAGRLPHGTDLEPLQWLEVTPSFERVPGALWPLYQPAYKRQHGTLRLMQNFAEDVSFYEGTGLVQPGDYRVLSGDAATLVADCRALDLGARYQALLGRVFNPTTCAWLAEGKRAGLKLAIEIANLQGHLQAFEQIALREIADGNPVLQEAGLRSTARTLKVLDCVVADAMVVQLRDNRGADRGAVLYLPSAPSMALRCYPTWGALGDQLVHALRGDDYREYFSQLIAIGERSTFLDTLGQRLKDDQPDLGLEQVEAEGDIFAALVGQQVQRAKDDARLLLVCTADADEHAAGQRLQQWRSAGMTLASLAGLFIPVVGELLLGQFVVQVTREVYEGLSDWHQGHQHEALEHMLGVAEVLAVNAAVAGGASVVASAFTRSRFVEGLDPVDVEGRKRLWSNDLGPYTGLPDADGPMFTGASAQPRPWLRLHGHYYQVHRPVVNGPWRLLHRQRARAYGPAVDRIGEHGWRLRQARPLEWQDEARMLDSLWPQQAGFDVRQARQVLNAAGMDQDELRGLLVENRELPVNLRDTLQRLGADARIERFFRAIQYDATTAHDTEIQEWCMQQVGIRGLEENHVASALLAAEPGLREPLLEHLTRAAANNDPLLTLLRRDFPGLPQAYAESLLTQVTGLQRTLALAEAKLPLSVAGKARSLSQSARLNRSVEGLYSASSCGDDSAALVLALLGQLPNWPRGVNLALHEGSPFGRRLALLDTQGEAAATTVLVRQQGQFRLYDSQGLALGLEGEAPTGLFEVITALLSAEQRKALSLGDDQPAARLREMLHTLLPDTTAQRIRLLGWREEPVWFNPGRRLPDGRVGYPLSGRGQGVRDARQVLRDRLRALYPGLADAELDQEFEQLLAEEGPAYSRLLEREDDYDQLEQHLNRWVSADLQESRQAVRQRFSETVQRAWRRQGDPSRSGQGQRLSVNNLSVRTLPQLPGQVAFPQVTELVINGTPLSVVPPEFLQGFQALRELNLANNQLLQLPAGIGYLVGLRSLRLGYNRIRMDSRAVAVLASLPELSHLDLTHNPIGALQMRFNQLPRLSELNLRHCGLVAWPSNIELCGLLQRADLRGNQLSVVPPDILQMPHAYRRVFLVDGNPLPRMEVMRLFALDPVQEHLHQPEALHVVDVQRTRSLWIAADASDVDAQRWDRLQSMPGSAGFIRLLGLLEHTSDFTEAHAVLAGRVSGLLTAIERDAGLREDVLALADQPVACENSVAARFSDLQVRLATAQADQLEPGAMQGTELLALGRGLFRLQRLERFALNEIRGRVEARERVDRDAVTLFYRVQLRQRLSLPGQPVSMLHGTAAEVRPAQVEAALAAVRAAETPQALAQDLSQRRFWQRFLRNRQGAAFTAIEQTYTQRLGQLEGQAPPLPDDELRRQRGELAGQQAAELELLMHELTRQFLYGLERGRS